MGEPVQKKRKGKDAAEKLASQTSRPKTNYTFDLGVPAPTQIEAEIHVDNEHSSFGEQTQNMSAHEQTSNFEQGLSSHGEQGLSRDHEQTLPMESSVYTPQAVHNIIGRSKITSNTLEVFAFIDHLARSAPDHKVGRVVYETFIKGPKYITIRRALDFWQKLLAIKVVDQNSTGTTWSVDPVFSEVMRLVFEFPEFPPFKQQDFLNGAKLYDRKKAAAKNEQTSSRASLERENKNLISLSEINPDEIEEYWPSLFKHGFRSSHLRQIERAFAVQEADCKTIPMYLRFIDFELAHGLCKDRKGNDVADPLAWFMASMKKSGYYRKPDGYIDPRVYAEKMQAEEMRQRLEAECERRYLENEEKTKMMVELVEKVQQDLAQTGIRSHNFEVAKEICIGAAFDQVTRNGDSAWSHRIVGAALRTACIKEYVSIEVRNGKPYLVKLKDKPKTAPAVSVYSR